MKYNITAKETFSWNIAVEADSRKEGLQKAKEYWNNTPEDDGYTGVCEQADAENVRFIIK